MGGLFGSAGMLWWGLAAAIPVLIHLFARQRYKRVPWAAMEFLLRAYKKTRKRIRLEHILLLLLRILAVLLFVLALADPHVEGGGLLSGGADGPRDVIIVIDDSFSMAVRDSSGNTPFNLARQQALRLVASLRRDRGDTISLVTTGKPARAILIGVDDLERARQELEQVEVGDGATDFSGAFRTVLAALEDLPRDRGAEVFVFTDAQRTALAPEAARETPDAPVEVERPQQMLLSLLQEIRGREAEIALVIPGGEGEDNVSVTAVESASPVVTTGVSTRFSVTIENFGRRSQGGAVHLFVDGGSKPVEVQNLDLVPAGRPETVTFRHTFRVPGYHYVEARYVTDGLETDNRRGLALEVRERIRTVLVDGDPAPEESDRESFFLRAALAPDLEGGRGSLFSVEVVEETRLDALDLRDVDLLALLNVGLISPRKAGEIEEWVKQGGGLFVFLGDKVDAATLNGLLWKGGAGVLPAELKERKGVPRFQDKAFELQVPSYDHPALAYFADPAIRTWLTLPPFYEYFLVEAPAEDPSVRTLALFDLRRAALGSRDPALLERRFGSGRSVLFTSSADDGWNDLPSFPSYLLMFRELANHLVRRDASLENFTVGAGYDRVLRSFAREVVVSRDGEQLQVVRPLALENDQGYELRLPPLTKAGVYRLDLGGVQPQELKDPNPIFVAVNVETAESDLSRLDEDELLGLFPGVDLDVGTEIATNAEGSRPGRSRNLWWWVLLGGLLMLVSETVLAQLFGLRARGA